MAFRPISTYAHSTMDGTQRTRHTRYLIIYMITDYNIMKSHTPQLTRLMAKSVPGAGLIRPGVVNSIVPKKSLPMGEGARRADEGADEGPAGAGERKPSPGGSDFSGGIDWTTPSNYLALVGHVHGFESSRLWRFDRYRLTHIRRWMERRERGTRDI